MDSSLTLDQSQSQPRPSPLITNVRYVPGPPLQGCEEKGCAQRAPPGAWKNLTSHLFICFLNEIQKTFKGIALHLLLRVLSGGKMRQSQFGRCMSMKEVNLGPCCGGIVLLLYTLGPRGEVRYLWRGHASASAPPGFWGCRAIACNIQSFLLEISRAARRGIRGLITLHPLGNEMQIMTKQRIGSC